MFNYLGRLYKIFKIKQKTKNVIFMKGANPSKRAVFEGYNKLGYRTWFDGLLGYGSYVGDDSIILADVGKYCSIGSRVNVLTGTHPSHVFVSTSPMFYSLALQNGKTYVKQQKFQEDLYIDKSKGYGCKIGNDVWIGNNVSILGGVTIGDGAIIAANSFVNKDVEPYTIVAGLPIRVINKRFTDEQIEWLLRYKWWQKEEEWIAKNAGYFDNIETFIKELSE